MADNTDLILKLIETQNASIKRIDGNIDSIFRKIDNLPCADIQLKTELNANDIEELKTQPQKRLTNNIALACCVMMFIGLILTIWRPANGDEATTEYTEDRVSDSFLITEQEEDSGYNPQDSD